MCIYIKGYLDRFMVSMIDISVKLVRMAYMLINYYLSDKKGIFTGFCKATLLEDQKFTPRVSIDMIPSI